MSQAQRTDFVRVRSDYTQAVKRRFDEAAIAIPFPQRTLSGSLDSED